ncbi:hypothetical protein M0R04_11185 [Candidatus Dojkabacteria bacterium]|jgi:hypothetical protein|nr:hypothetical protein [Candidatus Dojkabacteria bacterium]
MNKIAKIKTIIPLCLIVVLLCAYLVFGTTGISGADATPTGADGIQYVTNDSVINHTAALTFSYWTNETNLSFTNWRASVDDIENLTFWTDIDGTWKSFGVNRTAVTLNATYGFNVTNIPISYEGTVLWNIQVWNISNLKSEWVFSTNKSYTLDYVQIRNKAVSPVSGTVFTTSTPEINLTVLGTESVYYCCLYMENVSKVCRSDVLNNTLTSFISTEITTAGSYESFFNCTKSGSGISNRTTNFTIKYVSAAPTVTVNVPVNPVNYWSSSNTVVINLSSNGTLITNCSIYGNFAGAWVLNQTKTGMTSGLVYNFSIMVADNHTGYLWGYRCKNEASQVASANYTLFVDTLYPVNANCSLPINLTRGTDYTPTLSWTTVGDTGFDRYTLFLMNDSTGYQYSYNITDSNATSSFAITTDLNADMQWYWNISVTDKAGNTNISGNCFSKGLFYYPDSVGHTLLAGYNFFSIVRNTDDQKLTNVTGICSEPSVTPTSISKWNFTKNGWATHVCGTSTNKFNLTRGEAIVINMPSAGVWETGRVWDMTNTTMPNMNITNVSGVVWSLVGVMNDSTLLSIDHANMDLMNYGLMSALNPANVTTENTLLQNVTYWIHSNMSTLIVYNASPIAVVPADDYTINLVSGRFEMGTPTTAANFTGLNLTFDYTFYDGRVINWISYPNHSQVNVPFKSNWTLNGAVNVFNGDAIWVALNSTIQTTLTINRTLWR